MNGKEFKQWSAEMTDYVVNYLENIGERRVVSDVKPGFLAPLLPKEAPEEGEDWKNLMKDLDKIIMPGLTHWQHPHNHAYFPSAATYPGIVADMITGALGIMGFTWLASPAITELEIVMSDWMARALGLPKEFIHTESNGVGGGALTTSASESIFAAMLGARKQAIDYIRQKENIPEETHDSEIMGRLVSYSCSEAHSSIEKGALMAAVRMRIIPADENNQLPPKVLEEMMAKDAAAGLHPTFVIATLGTTGSTAFDDLKAIGAIVKKYPACWFHADGAYGASMFICPEKRYLMDGFSEYVDSLDVNSNKWLLINYDCNFLFTRNINALTKGMVVNPLYLKFEEQIKTPELRHWGVPLSRRFRSLKVWFTMRVYGIKRLQEYIRRHCDLAKEFEQRVLKDDRFEVMNKVEAGLVAFRLKGDDDLSVNVLARINHAGKLHMVPTMIRGKYTIRYSVNHEQSSEENNKFAWDEIIKYTDEVIADQATGKLNEPENQKVVKRYSYTFTPDVSADQFKRAAQISLMLDGVMPIFRMKESS